MNINNRPGPARSVPRRLTGYVKAYGEKLPERHVRMLWQHQRQLSLIEEEMTLCEREIARLLESPRFAATAALLRTAPGVGPIVSATVLAEVGDFAHFPDGKAIGRYAGMTPRVFASGGKERHGHISKTGPRDMRWVLQQAAWVAIRCDTRIKKRWLKIAPWLGQESGRGRNRSSTVGRLVADGPPQRDLSTAGHTTPGGGVNEPLSNEC